MSKGLFDKASLYREEFLARPNEGLLAQALDYLNSKDNAEAAAEIKSSGEPSLPSLPDASEFHPIDEPTVADIMPDEETVRQRLAAIEEQVCAAENETSTTEPTNSTEQADTKSEETFFLEGNAVQEQQPDYEEEVLIIDLPQDDDPFAALLAQMGGESGQTTSETETPVSSAEPVEEQEEMQNEEADESVISTEVNEVSEAEKSEEEISSADENLETPIADEEPAKIEETAEKEPSVEEVTQGTSFVGNNIVYDPDAVTQKTYTDNNVSFTELPPTKEPAPESDNDLPTGILTTEQSEDDTIIVPAGDEDEEEDMTELPPAEDLPSSEDGTSELDESSETIAEEENYFADDNIEWLYPADRYDENGNIKDNEQDVVQNAEEMQNEESSADENLETPIADEESAEIEETDVAEEVENVDASTEETDELVEEIPSADENEEDVISTEAEKSSSDEDTPKQYDDYLAVLDDISAQTAAISIDENMFDNFLACVADRFEIDKCGLLLFDPDDGQFKCMAKIDYDDETEEKLSFDLNYNNIYGNLANKKSYLVHRDEPQFGGLADIMSEKDFAEAEFQLWLPFVFSSRIIGIMLVTHSVADVTDDYIRALEVAGRLNGATLYNLYQQYTVLCEEYEDEEDEVDAETLAEANEEEYDESDISTEANEVSETDKSDEVPADTEEIIEDDDAEFSEEELAAELMSEWDIAAGENEEADEQEEMQNEEDDEPVISTEAEKSDEADEDVQAEIPSVIADENDESEEISSPDENDENVTSTEAEKSESDNSSPDDFGSIMIDESTLGEEADNAEESDEQSVYDFAEEANDEEMRNAECVMRNEEDVISTEANEESEAEKSDEANENSIIIEETPSEDTDATEDAINETMLEDMGLALPDDEPVEVLPIPDDLDAKYRGLATFMHDLRETGAALSLCRVILTSYADVTAAIGEFSLIQFAEDIKGTTQSIIGGDSFVEVTDPDKFYIVLPNAEKEEAQAATEMIIEQIVGLFSEAFGNAAEFRFECTANDTFTQSNYLSLLNELS